MSPIGLADNRSTVTVERGGHRLTVVVDVSLDETLGETFEWTARYRKEWRPNEGQTWRLHLGAGGQGPFLGGVVGFVAALETRGSGRWKLGCAQAWGHSEAPVQYITGWGRLPARAFRDGDAHAFIRFRSIGGRTEWVIRLSLQDRQAADWEMEGRKTGITWFGVDFRPGRRRHSRSGRRYIGRAEHRAVLPPPNHP